MHDFIEAFLPYVISALEIMGIFVVCWSAIIAFWHYIENTFMNKDKDIQFSLAKGLATGLEFKLAAEILKTVLIHTMEELYILGAVILLRALMSVLIHFEMKHAEKELKLAQEERRLAEEVEAEAEAAEAENAAKE